MQNKELDDVDRGKNLAEMQVRTVASYGHAHGFGQKHSHDIPRTLVTRGHVTHL